MIASVLIGKLCVIATVVAVALVLEVVVQILKLKWIERMEAEEVVDVGGGVGGDVGVGVDSGSKPEAQGDKFRCPPPPDFSTSVSPDLATSTPVSSDAERLWAEASGMTHSEIPSFETDWHYMTLVHKAAELGYGEAMSALGDFAFQRGDVVEAFYWKLRVEMGGGRCRNPSLTDIIDAWTEVGCPDGSEDIGAGLSEQRADFAHAVLCLKSRVDPRYGTVRLKELADAGDEDATRFLKRR